MQGAVTNHAAEEDEHSAARTRSGVAISDDAGSVCTLRSFKGVRKQPSSYSRQEEAERVLVYGGWGQSDEPPPSRGPSVSCSSQSWRQSPRPYVGRAQRSARSRERRDNGRREHKNALRAPWRLETF